MMIFGLCVLEVPILGLEIVLGLSLCSTYIHTIFSYILEFNCNNNIVEYESFILGLNISPDMKIKCLKIIGEFYLVFSQIKYVFSIKNEWLRRYRNEELDTIEQFHAIASKEVWREENVVANKLLVETSTLQPCT